MSRRILVPLLLILALLLLLYFLRPGESVGRQAELARGAVEEPPSVGTTRDLELAETPDGPAGTGAEAPDSRRELPSEDEVAARTWAEEDTRWLDVRLILPDATPGDERAWVLALDGPRSHAALHEQEGPVRELRAGTDPRRVRGVLGAVLVDASGAARLGLPPDAEETWLAVSGSYLYSLESRRVEVGEATAPVELRPVLGAWVSGRLVGPGGGPDDELGQVEVRLTWSNSALLKLGAAGSERLNLKTTADSAGQFEFRAVPVGRPHTLSSEAPHLAAAFGEEFQADPGEHVRLQLALASGARLHGRVVDEEGRPIAGAEVMALGNEFFGNPSARLRETESDTEGLFDLSHVTPGRVWLRVRHEEYQDLLGVPFDLADGEERDQGDVTLGQGLTIAGTVLFPDGAPATGTRVAVSPDLGENLTGSAVDPRDFIGQDSEDTVDDTGAFRIRGLGKGPWAVSAELEITDEQEGDRTTGRWAASQGVVRPPAEEVHLVLSEPLFVQGTVVDGAGSPVTAFEIRGERAGSQWYMPPSEERSEAFESEDGVFRMGDLRAGNWTFTAAAEGHARSAEIEAALPGAKDLSLVLHRPVRLAGDVVDPDGRPVAGAEVSKELELAEVIEAQQGRGDWPTARSDAEGRFELGGLAPGAGSIMAKHDRFAPSEGQPYELAEGEARLDLVLRLRRGATLSGEVYGGDGQPAAGCLLILQMPTLQERRITNARADGTFREQGLMPGTWQVQAFPGIESLTSESGEALGQAELIAALKMTSVELVDEEEEHVVLGEPPANPVRVHGRVTLDGGPVAESVISFVPAQGGGMEHLRIETLDGDGRYALQLDEPGDFLVTIQTTGTPGRQNSIEFRRSVPEGEDHELDFALPLGRVSGRVRGPDGEPVSHARVTLNPEGGLVVGTVFGGQYNETATNADGEFHIPYLRPGRYVVAAGGASLGGLLPSSSELGRKVTTIEVQEDQWVRGLDFRLEEPGSIRGTVRDAAGQLVKDAAIFVRDEEGRLVELFSVAQTNASGSFDYRALTPGEYTVTARTTTLASAGVTPVRVRAGEASEVTVTVEAGTVLLVSLVDESGADVPSRVSVVDDQGREMNGMLGLAQIMELYDGGVGSTEQRVGPLPPGAYRVRAFAEDGRSAERPVTLTGTSERKVKLRFR